MERILHSAPPNRHPALWTRLAKALALRRQRHSLAELDDHLLNDIGIDRATALREAARPEWDAPEHWYR